MDQAENKEVVMNQPKENKDTEETIVSECNLAENSEKLAERALDYHYEPLENTLPEDRKRKPGRPKGSKSKPKPFTFTLPVYDKRNIPAVRKVKLDKKPGDDILFLMKVLALSQGCNQNSIEDMKARFHTYLQMCADENVKVGNLAAYMSFGVMNKQTADSWARGKKSKEHKEFMLYVRGVCGAMREGMVQDGKLNPVVGIFWEKNHDGFTDQPKTETTIVDPLGEMQEAEDIMKKYEDLPI